MHRFLLASLLLLISCTLHAQVFDVSISQEELFTSVNGAPSSDVDLMFNFSFDFADVLPDQGQRGGDLFAGLNYTVTSNDLGLNNVEATNLLDFVLNSEIGGAPDVFVLFNPDSGLFAGSGGYGGALSNFDGQSSFVATGGTGLTLGIVGGIGGFQTSLPDGTTLGVQFDNSGTTTVSFTAIPEPSAFVLLMAAVGGVLCSRRKSRVIV